MDKEWTKAAGELQLEPGEVGLAVRMHWTPQDVRAKKPSKNEPWKDEPALFIRRSYDRHRRHIRNTGRCAYDEKKWHTAKQRCRLDREEIRMAEEMKLTPEEVTGIGSRAALTIRRMYDERVRPVNGEAAGDEERR